MRESFLYEKLPGGRVRCDVCLVRCVIPDGKAGACRTRVNRDGALYTLLYGRTSSVCVDPIEKKPLFHFYPGTNVLSMGTRGCNFRCPGCQNWEISHDSPDLDGANMESLLPVASVDLAERTGCAGICWTYNDPTIWIEQTFEAMVEAKRRGLYSAYITNGYATPEHLERVAPYLTAWRLDLKGFSRESYKEITGLARWEEILEIASMEIKRSGYSKHLSAGIVLTGGGSLIKGTADLAREVMGMPVKIGIPSGFSAGLVREIENPIYATGVGLVIHELKHRDRSNIAATVTTEKGKGSVNSIFNRMKTWFDEL